MNLYKFVGSGLPNIYLDGGVVVDGAGDEQTISYSELDGLYAAITRALALCSGPMQSYELRFLRKRLGLSQAQVAALGEKTDQAVAKWEKGTARVQKAEASLLRLRAIWRFGSSRDISIALTRVDKDGPVMDCSLMVFSFDGSKWAKNEELAHAYATQQFQPEALDAIQAAMQSSNVGYTLDHPSAPVVLDTLGDGGKVSTV